VTLDKAADLKAFIAHEILGDEDIGELDAHTPLLDLGILNSIELTNLIEHIDAAYGVRVPPARIVPEHFASIASIASLVDELQHQQAVPAHGELG